MKRKPRLFRQGGDRERLPSQSHVPIHWHEAMTPKDVADWFMQYAGNGYPLQGGYSGDLLRKVLEIRAAGGTKPDQVYPYLSLDDMKEERRRYIQKAMEVWQHWEVLLEEGLRTGLISVRKLP